MKKLIYVILILLAFFCGASFSYFQVQGGAGHSNPWSLPGVSFNNFNSGNFIDDEYDLRIGNNDSCSVARIGNLEFGTSDDRTVGPSLTMGGAIVFASQNLPDGIGEFIWTTAGGDIRFALPIAGASYGTYNARSMIIAGPSVLKDSVMIGPYWGFNRIRMNTTSYGADLGIQNCIQIGDSCYVNTCITVGGKQFSDQSDSTLIDDDGITTTGDIDCGGKLIANTATQSVVGPTDNVDVAGINILFIDTNANNVTIGAFINGVSGQPLEIVVIDAGNNTILEHNEATANQNIFLSAGADETLTASYGGWKLVCNGTSWFELDN